MKRIQEIFKNYFATGLLVIVPIYITLWLIGRFVLWVDEIFAVNQWSPVVVPGLGMVLAVTVILLAGVVGRNVLGSWVVANISDFVKHVPVIGSVYGALRQTLQALFTGGGKKFGEAVLVEYPRPGMWTIAFVTSQQAPPKIRSVLEQEVLVLYVPTTPNPTSGFLLFVSREQTRHLDMKVEDALKLVVSLGLVEVSEERQLGEG